MRLLSKRSLPLRRLMTPSPLPSSSSSSSSSSIQFSNNSPTTITAYHIPQGSRLNTSSSSSTSSLKTIPPRTTRSDISTASAAVGAALGSLLILLTLLRQNESGEYHHHVHAEENSDASKAANAAADEDREFTRDQVAKHRSVETGVWVTYGRNVYDVTEFLDLHPGGRDKILLAAGGAIDPYWAIYAHHADNPDTLHMLEKYRIGRLAPGQEDTVAPHDVNDPYSDEPARLPVFNVRTQKPFNAETPPELLIDSFITPNELFFVRNHLPVPRVEPEEYRLQIGGKGVRELHLTLDELKSKFPHHSVVTTVQCAGNRRTELSKVKPVKGIDWMNGAIGTAEWTGVRLRDVLQYAGLDVDTILLDGDDNELRHVQFEGLDIDLTKTPYGSSIPIEKAVDPLGDVILAFKMNGVEIPRDHGYPVRAIVPGVVGARNVKWLGRINVSTEESSSFWQQKDYKGFSPGVSFETVDYSSSPAIQELPVQSAICSPNSGDVVTEDTVTIKGYAWSGGGRDIIRVDITPDNGHSWLEADMNKELDQKPSRAWAWTPFEAEVLVPHNHNGEFTVCSKAVDSAYNVQPERPDPIWNVRGVLSNAWSCIKLHTANRDKEDLA